MTYQERLAAFVADHPDRVAERGVCRFCGVSMEDRINEALTDHSWVVVGTVPIVDDWERIDYLRDNDVPAYSKAMAHRGLLGQWPWRHNCHCHGTTQDIGETTAAVKAWHDAYWG